jgi:thiamine biosynthesis protein ThiI
MRIVVKYHEIALKGGNRGFFVARLLHNLRRATAEWHGKVGERSGRIFVELPDTLAWEAARARIAAVLGVANFSRVRESPADLDELERLLLQSLDGDRFLSFRVRARRTYKPFPFSSMDIERRLGAAINTRTGARVDLSTAAERTFFVDVLKDRILFTTEREQGVGGFPVGSSGRVMALLSGGIDSPVAAYRLMRRGCTILPVHFHAFPLQDHDSIDKARELARVLAHSQFELKLFLVPFGATQQTIVAQAPAPLRVVLYRRFMVRVAERLGARYGVKALCTGESVAQVASQTLDNIATVDAAARGPILRPLVAMDKDEIMREARRIGTYDISIRPDQDCCQIFSPRNPAVAAKVEEAEAAERSLDVAGLVAACVQQVTIEKFVF